MLYCLYPVGKGGGSVGEEKDRKSKKARIRRLRPTDTADDADGLKEDEGAWWEDEPEEKVLARIRESYREDYDEDHRDNEPDDEAIEIPLENLLLDGVALELKLSPEEKEELEETEGRKLLQREMRDEALRRYEEAARTVQDFKNLHATWDKLDANRERKERYHELLRGDVPIDYDVDYASTTFIPRWRNDPMERQMLQGYFLDYFCNCPYEMHDLTTKEYLRQILMGLKEEHKEIFYFLFLRQFSPQYVALMRGQTDRNIRKVRDTVLRKIRKKMNKQLLKIAADGYRLGEREMQFLFNYRLSKETPEEEDVIE